MAATAAQIVAAIDEAMLAFGTAGCTQILAAVGMTAQFASIEPLIGARKHYASLASSADIGESGGTMPWKTLGVQFGRPR